MKTEVEALWGSAVVYKPKNLLTISMLSRTIPIQFKLVTLFPHQFRAARRRMCIVYEKLAITFTCGILFGSRKKEGLNFFFLFKKEDLFD